MGLRVLLDVSALLLEPFSREGVGGPRGLTRRNKEVVVLASLSRVRFGECLLSEFLQSEHLVGLEVQEVWGILWLRVEYLQLCS